MLAAGTGTRLRPLTELRPKALCPVDNSALVDLALARVEPVTASVAVNVHAGRALLEEHLSGRVHLSIEEPVALGTAGALGRLRDWVAGRPVLVVNADAWTPPAPGGLRSFVEGWDGGSVRVLTVDDPRRADFAGGRRYAGACLLPWTEVSRMPVEAAGLYEVSWRKAEADGRLDAVLHDGPFFDCGTFADYLAANLTASGGRSVIGPGAVVEGRVERSVVWPGALVRVEECLVDAIRAHERITVLVR